MSYSFKFVRTVNGKTVTEKHPDNQSAHTAMGIYAGQHDLKIDCIFGRFGALSKSIMYKGDDPVTGAVGYVSWNTADGAQPSHRGRVREQASHQGQMKSQTHKLSATKTKSRKKKSS